MKTKNVSCEDESPIGGEDIETPPRKKLKQARLPFQILSPGVESPSPSLKNSNKRKLSESTDDIKIVKIIRPNDSNQLVETKENVCSSALTDDCKISAANVGKTLRIICDSNDVEDHIKKSVVARLCETVSNQNAQKSESNIKELETINEVEKTPENNSPKEKIPKKCNNGTLNDVVKICDNSLHEKISKKSNEGSLHNDIIILSNSEDNEVQRDLTACSNKSEPLNTQNHIQDETVESKSNVAHSTDTGESETDKSLKVLEDSYDVSVNIDVQSSPLPNKTSTQSELDTANSKLSDSADKSTEYIPNGLRTPKHFSTEVNSKECDTNNIRAISKEDSPQTSVCNNLMEYTPNNGSRTLKQVSPDDDVDSAQNARKLTPKQMQKQLESAKKKEEKEKQRQEREKKRAEEKEEKLKQRLEKEGQKKKEKEEKEEQKRKEREEKEEQKRKEKEEKEEIRKKEKEEKERKKQVELEMKNEERRAKDEEKRKKEDKRQAEVAAFTSFFRPKKAESKPVEEPKIKNEANFMPFEVKVDMRLAPSTRRILTVQHKETLDKCMLTQSENQSYLEQIKNKIIVPQRSSCTWALSDFKDDIVILDDDEISGSVTDNIVESYPAAGQLPHPKLLQFWENRRPPYWGTWRKKSHNIGPTKPFMRDKKFFEYEVDSDDEWEEEEPGESLHGSDDEKESEDEYEVDNEFFVPHGYLSDEENEGQEDEDQSPEMLKTKLKMLELEFEEEMKQKTERIKPRLIGCIWIDSKTAESAGSQLMKLLSPYQAVYCEGPIVTSASDSTTSGSPESKGQTPSPTTPSLKRKKFPEAAIPALIKLIHGNVNRREFLIKEFLAYWNKEQRRSLGEVTEGSVEGIVSASPSPGDIFKKSVSNKIKELATWVACPDDCPMIGRMCWYVPPETRFAHGLSDITIPNTLWNYTFKPRRRESDMQLPSPSTALGSELNPKQLITKFTKIMTEVERKKQFNTAGTGGEICDTKQADHNSHHVDKTQRKLVFNSYNKSFSSNGEQYKKVTILSSLPKEQELPKPHSNSLMKFIKTQGCVTGEEKKLVPNILKNDKAVSETEGTRDEECIVLSD